MASRFWVGGTGTWDASDTTHWAASTGGAGGQSVPGSSDTVTFDGNSGGGTVTVNTNVAVISITGGAFTGTLDFSANNNNVTLTGASGFTFSGTGTRTLNMGNGTWTISSNNSNGWLMTTTTNLTFNANSSTLVMNSGLTSSQNFAGGGLTYNVVTFNGNSSKGGYAITGANTFTTLNLGVPNAYEFNSSFTVTNGLNVTGTSSNQAGFSAVSFGIAITITSANNHSFDWCAFRDITFSGGTNAATNSFDLGRNTNITITAPSAGGAGGGSVLRGGVIA